MEEKKKFDKQKYDNQYIKENKDRINFVMDKGTKDRINEAVAKTGCKSAAEYIRNAIEAQLFKDGIEKKISVEDPGNQETQN